MRKSSRNVRRIQTLRVLPPSLRACAGSYVRPPRRRPRNCVDCGAECQRARVCAINRHRRCSGCYRRKQRKQPRTFSSHASTAHLDATLAHSFTITATCMHKHTQRGSTYRAPSTCTLLHHRCNMHAQAHTEGQHLQDALNLQVAKALRKSCQLIVRQVPATGITPPPISVTADG